MFLNVHDHIKNKIHKAEIVFNPFKYTVVDDIFPENFYQELIEKRIPEELLFSLKEMNRVGAGYSDSRKILKLKDNMPYMDNNIRGFYENITKYLRYHFSGLILDKFNIPNINLGIDLLYVKDSKNYRLGPHTDHKRKVLTALFYLPEVNSINKFGTSIYKPKKSNFTCEGGHHYKSEFFEIVKTIEFKSNRLFCFEKSNNSFHGVEHVDKDIERNLLIFDIQKKC